MRGNIQTTFGAISAANTLPGAVSGPPVIPSARYWKIVDMRTYTFAAYMAELELASEANGTDLYDAASSPSISSDNDQTDGVANLVDNNSATRYDSDSRHLSFYDIQVDLGSGDEAAVNEVRFMQSSTWTEQLPNCLRVMSSDDGTTWTDQWACDNVCSKFPPAGSGVNDYMPYRNTQHYAGTAWSWNEAHIGSGHTLSSDWKTLENTNGAEYTRSVGSMQRMHSTFGKVYWEIQCGADGDVAYNGYLGIAPFPFLNYPSVMGGNPVSTGAVCYRGNGTIWAGGAQQVSGLATYGNDDTVMFCFDTTTGELWVGVNGTWADDPESDPATYTTTPGEYWIIGNVRDDGNIITMATLAEDFNHTKPSTSTALASAEAETTDADFADVVMLMGWDEDLGDQPTSLEVGGGTLSYNSAAAEVVPCGVDGLGGALYCGSYVDLSAGVQLTGDFTIECWILAQYLQVGTDYFVDNHAAASAEDEGWYILMDSAEEWFVGVSAVGGDQNINSSVAVSDSQWDHVAITRSGSTVTLWVNGVSAGTMTYSGNFGTTSNAIRFGRSLAGANSGPGIIDEFRITDGTCRYTSAFYPDHAKFPRS